MDLEKMEQGRARQRKTKILPAPKRGEGETKKPAIGRFG
jgi:hypothetical protein